MCTINNSIKLRLVKGRSEWLDSIEQEADLFYQQSMSPSVDLAKYKYGPYVSIHRLIDEAYAREAAKSAREKPRKDKTLREIIEESPSHKRSTALLKGLVKVKRLREMIEENPQTYKTLMEVIDSQAPSREIQSEAEKKRRIDEILEEQRRIGRLMRSEQASQDAYCLSKGWAVKKQLQVGVDYKHDSEPLNVEFIMNSALELKDVDHYPDDAAAENRKYMIVFLGKAPREKDLKSLSRRAVDYEVFPKDELAKWLQEILSVETKGFKNKA